MTRFVIGPGAAVRVARERVGIPDAQQGLASALLRLQEMTQLDAERDLTYLRGLRIRLLGDRVLQNAALSVAEQFEWPDTLDAEYVALTQLQADAFLTFDEVLAHTVKDLFTVAPFDALAQTIPGGGT